MLNGEDNDPQHIMQSVQVADSVKKRRYTFTEDELEAEDKVEAVRKDMDVDVVQAHHTRRSELTGGVTLTAEFNNMVVD